MWSATSFRASNTGWNEVSILNLQGKNKIRVCYIHLNSHDKILKKNLGRTVRSLMLSINLAHCWNTANCATINFSMNFQEHFDNN